MLRNCRCNTGEHHPGRRVALQPAEPEGELDLADYKDSYQEELQRIIDAKIAGEEVVATEEQAPPKVVNLMDALRQSLDRVSTGKKKAAKVIEPESEARLRRRKARQGKLEADSL